MRIYERLVDDFWLVLLGGLAELHLSRGAGPGWFFQNLPRFLGCGGYWIWQVGAGWMLFATFVPAYLSRKRDPDGFCKTFRAVRKCWHGPLYRAMEAMMHLLSLHKFTGQANGSNIADFIVQSREPRRLPRGVAPWTDGCRKSLRTGVGRPDRRVSEFGVGGFVKSWD